MELLRSTDIYPQTQLHNQDFSPQVSRSKQQRSKAADSSQWLETQLDLHFRNTQKMYYKKGNILWRCSKQRFIHS